MRKTIFTRTALLCCLLLFSAGFCAAEDIKKIHPSGYVSDLAGVIGPEARARLEALCAELEQKTGAQMAIVTVQSLEGESVENYAVDLFKQLGVGNKKDKRGILLLVAPSQRKYRIEVGYGLEPVINDARAGDAGRAMVPFLRQNDYGKAAEIAAWQLAKYIADDAGVTLSSQPPAPRRQHGGGNVGFPLSWIPVFWILLFVFVFFRFIASLAGRGGPGGSGCLWFLLGMLASNSGRGSGGGWAGGGFGGGGGGSGGDSGGGGFGGFGGGESGGGGASGDW